MKVLSLLAVLALPSLVQAANVTLLPLLHTHDFSHSWTGAEIYDGTGLDNAWVGGTTNPAYTLSGNIINLDSAGTSQGNSLTGTSATDPGGGAATWNTAISGPYTLEVTMRVNDAPEGFRFWMGNDQERNFFDLYNDRVVTTNEGGGLKTVTRTVNDGEFHTYRFAFDNAGPGNTGSHVWIDGERISDDLGGVYNSGTDDSRLIFGDTTSGTFGNDFDVDIASISFVSGAFYVPEPSRAVLLAFGFVMLLARRSRQ